MTENRLGYERMRVYEPRMAITDESTGRYVLELFTTYPTMISGEISIVKNSRFVRPYSLTNKAPYPETYGYVESWLKAGEIAPIEKEEDILWTVMDAMTNSMGIDQLSALMMLVAAGDKGMEIPDDEYMMMRIPNMRRRKFLLGGVETVQAIFSHEEVSDIELWDRNNSYVETYDHNEDVMLIPTGRNTYVTKRIPDTRAFKLSNNKD